jgi:ubiquinone/menaquinone biosynthesis C-methylase UbiE
MPTHEKYPPQDQIPHVILGQIEMSRGERRWFYSLLASHLLSAFIQWQDYLTERNIFPEVVRQEQQTDPYKDAFRYVRQALYFLSFDNHLDIGLHDDAAFEADPTAVVRRLLPQRNQPVNGRGHLFYADIAMPDDVRWTEEVVRQVFGSWLALLDFDNWEKARDVIGISAVYEFPHEVYGFPNRIIFGSDLALRLDFNRFLVADFIRYPPYVSKFFDYIARKYESIVPIDLKLAILRRLFSFIGKNATVLDIAAGTGLALQAADPSIRLLGVDISKEMARIANERGEMTIIADAHHLDTIHIKVDHAIMSFGEYWIYDLPGMLRSVAMTLPSGGIFAFNIHKPPLNWQEYYHDLCLGYGFSRVDFFQESIERSGEAPYRAFYVVAYK